ncbi:MAG TPA: family 16 glycoside hydrolase, partial [Verrucomicrobiae bacterium]
MNSFGMLRRGSFSRRWLAAWLSFAGLGALGMADPQIEVAFDHITHTNTPFLAGACLEDVNHEIYGGLDSQLLFGESFQEPPKSAGIRDFTAYGGRWQLTAEGVAVAAGPGDKMVYQPVELRDGVVTVALKFTGDQPGNAGLILHCSRPGVGADAFTGYEIALSPTGHFVLARHRQNFEPLQDVPCVVPRQQWIRLAVQIAGSTLAVSVDGHRITTYRDDTAPLSAGQIALRTWQADVSFRQLTWQRSGQPEMVPLIADKNWQGEVSGAWDACVAGTALGQWSLAARQPWVGRQSQALEFKNGTGLVGIENAGLNRQGIYLAGGRPYEGYVWVRPAGITHFQLALRGNETSPDLAVTNLTVTGTNWQRLDFQLAPAATDTHGRFRLALSQPGRLEVGYAFLQPGEWGRFAGLPVRRDVADALQNLGVKLLRYGGSMVNAPEYRWEKMIGPRAQRPPYRGTWYAESSNGWG